MKKIIKIVGIALLALIVFSIMLAIFSPNEKKDTNQPVTETSTEPVYKDVMTFKGNGAKKSESFHLSGNDAKLVYKYNSMDPEHGAFNVYVVEKGKDVMVEGGVPEIMIMTPKEESEGTIQKLEGDYYLNVSSVGNWEVTVQEKQ